MSGVPSRMELALELEELHGALTAFLQVMLDSPHSLERLDGLGGELEQLKEKMAKHRKDNLVGPF